MPSLRKHRDVRGRLMSQSEAARTLGIARSTVMPRVATGHLVAELVDGVPQITRASVEAYRAEREAAAQAAAVA